MGEEGKGNEMERKVRGGNDVDGIGKTILERRDKERRMKGC